MPTKEQLESALRNADQAGDAQAAKQLANALRGGQFDQPEIEPTAADYGQALVSGANILAPSLAGLPVDTARALANLGIAGYGVARKEIGEALGEEGYIPPEPLPPMPGGSEWMREKMTAGTQALGGGDPFALADPTDPTQQKLQMAGGIFGAGLMAPAAGVKQAAANIARMGVPAAGAVGMQAAFPEQPLAPMVGMMGAPAGLAAIKSKGVAPTKAFLKAHKLGYKVPPALARPSLKQNIVEGFGGTTPVSQKASLANQKITNELVKKDLGYPKDVALSREGLASMRAEAGMAYENAKVIGAFKADTPYTKALGNIAKRGSAMARDFPQAVRKDISEMVQGYAKKKMSAEGTIDAVRQLRAESNAGYGSSDPAIAGMAKAKGKVANALETLMERQAAKTHPELVPDLRAARQKIAKTYTIEKALKGENVDAVALGRELKKGKPLSGGIKAAAEFGEVFPKAAKSDLPQYTTVRPMDYAMGIGGAMVDPVYASLMAARPAARSLMLSKPYQGMLARQPGTGLMQIPKEAQAGAMATMLEQLQK